MTPLTRATPRAYAGPAAAQSAAGGDSPSPEARKRPSPDAGAFSLPGVAALGLREAQPAQRRAAWGSRKARRSSGRSVNPASSATPGDSAVADSNKPEESIMRNRYPRHFLPAVDELDHSLACLRGFARLLDGPAPLQGSDREDVSELLSHVLSAHCAAVDCLKSLVAQEATPC